MKTKAEKAEKVVLEDQLEGQLSLTDDTKKDEKKQKQQLNTPLDVELYKNIKDYCASHNMQISKFV